MSSESALLVRGGSWQERFRDQIRDHSRPLIQRRYFRLLARRWKMILLVIGLFIAGGLFWALTATPIYRSVATIQINPDDPNVSDFEGEASTYSGRNSEEYLLTAAATIQSRPVAERVVESLALSEDPRFQQISGSSGGSGSGRADSRNSTVAVGGAEGAVGTLLANLKTSTPRKTRLIEVSFTAPDPQLAAEIVDETIAQFVAKNLDFQTAAATAATDFLRQQLDELEDSIEASRTELVEYARSNNESLADGGQTTMTKLGDISKELTAAESELNALSLDHGVAMRATIEDFPVALATTTILDLERRLYELQREDAKLSARFGSNWPEVEELKSEIAQVGRQLEVKKQEAIDSIKFQYRKALDRRQRVAEALDAQRQNVEQFTVDSLRYGILERRAEAREELHSQLLDRLVEAYAEMEATTSAIRVVAPGSIESRAIYPRKIQGMILAAGLGLLVSLGLAVVLESLDERVMDDLDVSSLDLPVIGLIPSPGDDADGVAVPLGLPSTSTSLQPAGSSLQSAEARYWEAFRSLRASILLNQSPEEIPRTVLLTSALPGEGKTTTVAHMAVVLSRTGARTLMVDLDLRNPSLARRWASVAAGDGGISTLLAEDGVDAASLVKPTGLDNLFLLPAGAPTSDSIDLLNSGRLEEAMKTLRRMFDFIIIDTTSLHEVTDALALSRIADAVVMVVAAGHASRSAVRDATNRLEAAGANILGVALNRAETR